MKKDSMLLAQSGAFPNYEVELINYGMKMR